MSDDELKEILLNKYNEDEPHLDCVDTRDNAKWNLYIHIFPISLTGNANDKYYVGITSKNPIVRWGKNGKKYLAAAMHQAVQKYDWDKIQHEIIATSLTEEEAKNAEILFISVLKSNKPDYGYNRTNGGDGASGSPQCCENNYFSTHIFAGADCVNSKQIKLLNTGETFSCYREAGEAYGLSVSLMQCICSGKSRCTLKDKNERTLCFVYCEDYPNITNSEIEKIINYNTKYAGHLKRSKGKEFVCLNTGEIFDYAFEVKEKYNISSNDIIECCNHTTKSAGQLFDGRRMAWAYLEDYLNMSQEDIDLRIQIANSPSSRCVKIIDLKTLTVYDSIVQCLKDNNIGRKKLRNIITDRIKNTNDPFYHRFMYYEDYKKRKEETA